jgi:NADP-dependent 3-hydroxy acid dehydrogenase YdfG
LLPHAVDVTDRASVGELVRWASEQLSRIDVLVVNAGINIPNRTMDEMLPADWDRIIATNATGAYNCMHAVLPAMRERGDGLIVNISSISGVRASKLGGVAYNAAKFAQTALGLSVAQEVGKLGVRISNIYPGEVNTPILEHRPAPVSDEHKSRILQPEDVATAVLMIACLPPRVHVAELVIKPAWQEHA